MRELTIPTYKSNLTGVEIEVEKFPENLGKEGRGSHLLENGYWKVVVDNHSNYFLPKGFWNVYIVRSKIDQTIRFNSPEEDCFVIQMFPGCVPTLLKVGDVTADKETGAALTVYFTIPSGEHMKCDHGLHMYNT